MQKFFDTNMKWIVPVVTIALGVNVTLELIKKYKEYKWEKNIKDQD